MWYNALPREAFCLHCPRLMLHSRLAGAGAELSSSTKWFRLYLQHFNTLIFPKLFCKDLTTGCINAKTPQAGFLYWFLSLMTWYTDIWYMMPYLLDLFGLKMHVLVKIHLMRLCSSQMVGLEIWNLKARSADLLGTFFWLSMLWCPSWEGAGAGVQEIMITWRHQSLRSSAAIFM